MREVNVAAIDLNLVPALEALLRRRNVTHAADEVGLSQPAMSRSLARLRELQGDPLLVRTRSGYALTPRAEAIQPLLAQTMRNLRDLFQKEAFDPGTARRTVRFALADAHSVTIVPELMHRLASLAPGVDVVSQPYRADTLTRLERGEVDFLFALSGTPLPPGTHSEIVAEDRLALVMRRAHPAASKKWKTKDYASHQHVGVALLGDGVSDIDARLAAHGVSRRMAVVVPHFMGALATVAATDMVTTVAESLARRFADTFDLVWQAPPFGEVKLQMTLVCAHVRAEDPFLKWFRGLVKEVAGAVIG